MRTPTTVFGARTRKDEEIVGVWLGEHYGEMLGWGTGGVCR